MATFIATVSTGLEDIAADELGSLGLTVDERTEGAVFFPGAEFPSAAAVGMLRELNYWARGLERVGVLLARGRAVEVDDCYRLARGIDYGAFVRRGQSFAVRALRRGTHAFGSLDVAATVGEAVIDAYAAGSGHRWSLSAAWAWYELGAQSAGARAGASSKTPTSARETAASLRFRCWCR